MIYILFRNHPPLARRIETLSRGNERKVSVSRRNAQVEGKEVLFSKRNQ